MFVVCPTVTANVSHLGEEADLEALAFNLALMLLKINMFNLVLNRHFCQTAVSSLWLSFQRLNQFTSS
jgi:hypothetical protein